ncbi:unnamed protein product [Larinioides sclopetarius]|uniref:Uncharacterized protein n=1 Tax=Larinioides sclopetarius TaxID=280406 RepID=A0AAV1Z693_9ARAC
MTKRVHSFRRKGPTKDFFCRWQDFSLQAHFQVTGALKQNQRAAGWKKFNQRKKCGTRHAP